MGVHRKTETQPVIPVPVFPWRRPNIKFSAWSEARIRKELSEWLEARGLSRSPLLASPVDDYARAQYELLRIEDAMNRAADEDAWKGLSALKLRWIRTNDNLWKRIATGGELREPRMANQRPTPSLPPAKGAGKVTPIRSRWE